MKWMLVLYIIGGFILLAAAIGALLNLSDILRNVRNKNMTIKMGENDFNAKPRSRRWARVQTVFLRRRH